MKQIVIIFLFAGGLNLSSQTDSVCNFTLPEVKIYKKGDAKDVAYKFDKNKNKFILNDSSLIANPFRYNYKIKLSDINKISLRNGTNFWGGVAYGAAFGFVIGFFAGGYFTLHEPVRFHLEGAIIGSFVFAVPFGLLGGLIGLLSPKYDDFEIYKIKSENKEKYLLKIFNKYRLK